VKQLPPKDKRSKNWPKMCQESWLESFTKWKEEGGEKVLSEKTVDALQHALQCNLLYIEELEQELHEVVRRQNVASAHPRLPSEDL